MTTGYDYEHNGAAIYERSFATIRAEADLRGLSPVEARVAVRIIHACGMVEAARDLGASPWRCFREITLPLLMPGILAGALMAFTLSIDDFVITFFTAGVGSSTLPLQIYSMVKIAVTPEVNAVSTLLMLLTLVVITVASRLSPAVFRGE